MMKEKTKETSITKEETTKSEVVKGDSSAPKAISWTVIGGLALVMVVAAVLGLGAERRYGGLVLEKFPQLSGLKPKSITPTPSISTPIPRTSAIPLVSATPTKDADTVPTPPSDEEPTPPHDGEPGDGEPETEGTYILPFSNERAVLEEDLTELTPWELKVARNEIYARHGRPFVHKDLSCYFAKQSWYTLDMDYSDTSLSKLETKNATTILNYEKSIDSPLVGKDSGCK